MTYLILYLGLPFVGVWFYFVMLRAIEASGHPMKAASFWTMANLGGLVVYLNYDSQLWAPRGQEDLPGGAAEALMWSLRAMPVLLSFILLDLLWAGLIASRRRLRGRWWQLLVWVVVVAGWVAALGYARTRQFHG